MGDLKELVSANPNLGVIMVQETKLRPTDPDPRLPGFTSSRLDRKPVGNARGGGLITFVRKDIPFRRVEAFRPGVREEGLEALAVEIRLGKGRSFTCTNVYRPPVREGGHADLW